MRVITTTQRAPFDWRSPPRLSRQRVTLPDDAWMGATPHRCAHAASERNLPGLSPAATNKVAAVSTPTPCTSSRLGAVAATSGARSASMVASSSSRAKTRRPRMRMAVLVAVITGSPPARERSPAATPARWSRLAPRIRSRSSSGAVNPRWRIWLSDLILVERADRFATTSARMASTLPSRVLPAPWARPDSAARAASTASAGSDLPVRRRALRVGAVASDPRDARGAPRPRQAASIRAGALDPDLGDVAEGAQPRQELVVAGGRGFEALHAQQAADVVQRGGHMHIKVRVDTACHGARGHGLYDGHRHPFALVGQGVARAARCVRRRC